MSEKMTEAPKAAVQFEQEARDNGFTVESSMTGGIYEVQVKKLSPWDPEKTISATVTWAVTNTAPNNSRLGFVTTYRRGVRFWFATTYYYGWSAQTRKLGWNHGSPKSLRQVKGEIGIPV